MTITSLVCFDCKHRVSGVQGNAVYRCEAYPDGIPKEISDGADFHQNLRGDEAKPVHYEPEPGSEELNLKHLRRGPKRFLSANPTEAEIGKMVDSLMEQLHGKVGKKYAK